MALSNNPLETLVELLSLVKQKKSYTLVLGPGLTFTPALLHSRGYISWNDFYKYIERFSQQECATLLEAHFKTLEGQLLADYRHLAQLIQEGYFKAIFTTNVDTFLEDALYGLKQVKLLIRGTQTDEHIIKSLKDPSPEQTPVCLLRGHISGNYYLKRSETVKFSDPLESVVMRYLSEDMLLSGFIRSTDSDISRCIPKSERSIWYISPDDAIPEALPPDRYKGKVIRLDVAEFNCFFHTLSDALSERERKAKPHTSNDISQPVPMTEEQNQLNQSTMNMQDQQRDFFISYHSRDRQWAEWIAWELEDVGYSVFIQAWDFLHGGNFVLDMQRAASQSKRTIAVLSENYLNAQFTQPEWAAAFAQDPTGERGILLPVRVGKCEPKGILKSIVYIDLLGLDETQARKQLLKKVGGVMQQRNKPDIPPIFPG